MAISQRREQSFDERGYVKMNTCKDFLKKFRITVGAKPEERIDKRYKPYLAPNNRYYENTCCGYCAEVEYLSELYLKRC